MKIFFDSSAFAKRYLDEAGSDKVETLCRQADALGLSLLCAPEIISALNRRLRERSLSRAQYREAKSRLATEVRDAEIIDLTPTVIAESIRILETTPTRAMDALHVACAIAWGAGIFASADARQLAAARKAGLESMSI